MCLPEIGQIQNIIAAIIATAAAVIYNIAKHSHDKNVFKSNLFFSFNERYEKLRDELENLISWEANTEIYDAGHPDLETVIEEGLSDPLGESQKHFRPIFKYITLCSEQYYWHKRKMIDEQVWQSWKEAMLKWYEWSLSFRMIIEDERNRNTSYYERDFLSLFPPKN